MPELNPLSNEQIFLKKIAENTGSDYNTGDVSEINPLTIDQILLKKIAANTAGQSGDIAELEGKVADNTSAIEAIVNEYGSKNLLPFYAVSTVLENVTWTVDNAKKIITVDGTASNWSYQEGHNYPVTLKAGQKYILSSGVDSSNQYNVYVDMYDANTIASLATTKQGDIEYTPQTDITVYFNVVVRSGATVNNVEMKPMIRDARISDSTYAPYVMTNQQLTNISLKSATVTAETDQYGNLDAGVTVESRNIVGARYASNTNGGVIPMISPTGDNWYFKCLNYNMTILAQVTLTVKYWYY